MYQYVQILLKSYCIHVQVIILANNKLSLPPASKIWKQNLTHMKAHWYLRNCNVSQYGRKVFNLLVASTRNEEERVLELWAEISRLVPEEMSYSRAVYQSL